MLDEWPSVLHEDAMSLVSCSQSAWRISCHDELDRSSQYRYEWCPSRQSVRFQVSIHSPPQNLTIDFTVPLGGNKNSHGATAADTPYGHMYMMQWVGLAWCASSQALLSRRASEFCQLAELAAYILFMVKPPWSRTLSLRRQLFYTIAVLWASAEFWADWWDDGAVSSVLPSQAYSDGGTTASSAMPLELAPLGEHAHEVDL